MPLECVRVTSSSDSLTREMRAQTNNILTCVCISHTHRQFVWEKEKTFLSPVTSWRRGSGENISVPKCWLFECCRSVGWSKGHRTRNQEGDDVDAPPSRAFLFRAKAMRQQFTSKNVGGFFFFLKNNLPPLCAVYRILCNNQNRNQSKKRGESFLQQRRTPIQTSVGGCSKDSFATDVRHFHLQQQQKFPKQKKKQHQHLLKMYYYPLQHLGCDIRLKLLTVAEEKRPMCLLKGRRRITTTCYW